MKEEGLITVKGRGNRRGGVTGLEKWSSKWAFILAAVGSAVGIGNIWRFPSVVGQNGGGAYLLPFLLAVFAFAIPLMILELSVGRRIKLDVVSAFGSIKCKFRAFGWLICLVLFLLLSYYLVITGWTLAFAFFSLIGAEMTFSSFVSSYQPVVFFVICALITGSVVSLGVKKGIERITSILVPFSMIILVVMVVYCATLSGFADGLDYLFTPDPSVLGDPGLWSAAFGQAFFSLSVGMGVMLTYGMYLGREVSVPRSCLAITLADVSVALMAGLVIFPLVFTFGLQPAMGAELAFTVLPQAFDLIPLGQALAVAFFLLLFFAALTSAISMLEVNVTTIMKETSMTRERTSLFLTAGTLVVGIFPCLSYTGAGLQLFGGRILDLMDNTVGTLGLPITAIIISLVFSWCIEKRELAAEIPGRWFPVVLFTTRYLAPGILVMVTVISILQFLL
ncbi:MAG: sodium-dependent transporter [Methanomassiliicoccales archaeon]|nr:sodium-dependent transporter [Methanomassiliicoccales archaeon]